MEDLTNAMRREAERVAATVAQTRMGIVSGYDPNRHAVKLRLQPEGHETGWIPWGSLVAGNGWGIFAPPTLGMQAVVSFQEGNSETAVAVATVHSDDDRPEVEGIGNPPSGEIWLVHKDGARIRLTNDGTIELRQQEGTEAKLNPDGTVDILGPTIRIGAEGSLFRGLLTDLFITFFNQHTHPSTGPPVTPLTSALFTQALKGA
jgi:phage baseplate assembly protein V